MGFDETRKSIGDEVGEIGGIVRAQDRKSDAKDQEFNAIVVRKLLLGCCGKLIPLADGSSIVRRISLSNAHFFDRFHKPTCQRGREVGQKVQDKKPSLKRK
ncbi:uncharacterized protein G2W53_010811 [Senna tora]|uniref:Uncharacterized protein n=1 Tax=Senna tora TaxID=362788 RepID=A0A835CEG9_9FABA|nr:uncharacterized protein G2W53_010811 [Senna tora]